MGKLEDQVMEIMQRMTFLNIFLFFIFNSAVFSQEIQYDYIKEPVVLPGIQINCILKDSRGFIWFGTEQGLVKYDGYDYTMYNQVSGTQ
ncbi:MAG: two-component regulator propeller domain-containing protein, partial [bacterium]